MKIFLMYYLVSGLLAMVYVERNYETVKRHNPIIDDMFGKTIAVLFQFLFGFIVLPIALPLFIKNRYLMLKNTILKFKINMTDKKTRKARKKFNIELIGVSENDKFQFVQNTNQYPSIGQLVNNVVMQMDKKGLHVRKQDGRTDKTRTIESMSFIIREGMIDIYLTSELDVKLKEGWRVVVAIEKKFLKEKI